MTRHRFSFVDFALSLPWAKPVLALIAWIKKLRAKPDPYAELNRRQRRALMFAKPGERRMRLERTFLRIAERKRKKVGKAAALEYYTTHGRRRVLYRHEFKPHARPDFLVSGDGKMLLLLGGKFRFTARGIVDSRLSRS